MPSPRLAVYLAARSLLYFRHVLSHLPADEVDILVPRALCADQNPPNPTLAALRGQGYAVLPDDAARGRRAMASSPMLPFARAFSKSMAVFCAAPSMA